MKLYLGCGHKSLAGYIRVDLEPNPESEIVHDLNVLPWPWEDGSVRMMAAEDVVEHLKLSLIEFCNEAWRVLRPGGELFVRTPHHNGVDSWIDPTHRWHLHEQSFAYFDPDAQLGKTHSHCTPFKWRILSLGVRGSQSIHALMAPRK
jgi:hypothetical protein